MGSSHRQRAFPCLLRLSFDSFGSRRGRSRLFSLMVSSWCCLGLLNWRPPFWILWIRERGSRHGRVFESMVTFICCLHRVLGSSIWLLGLFGALSSFPPPVLFWPCFVVRGDDFGATQQQLACNWNVMKWWLSICSLCHKQNIAHCPRIDKN